jgi:colanic acid biosynthesis glycosyl transferase WcaI
MRILIQGINYAPELTGIGKYTGEMAERLAESGHEVTVITAPPYYPEWKIQNSYKGKGWHVEYLNGVRIFRVPLYVPAKVNSLKRIMHEFSFLLSTLPIWVQFIFSRKFDIVFSIAPPFHLSFLPLLYGKLRNVPVESHIQDLQVDAAKELGMIKNHRFLNLMFTLERFTLKHSSCVSTISNGMMRNILKKGIVNEKTTIVPNWVDTDFIKPLPPEASLRQKFNIPLSDKVVLYSGNLGEKQGLEIIMDVAEKFRSQSNLHFLIVGSGGTKQQLQQKAEERQLSNVHFYPLQPYEQLGALLATADVHLVLQRKAAADLVMPSKLSGILSAGGCAIVTASPGTYLYEIVDRNNMGIIVEPESPSALCQALINALNDSGIEKYKQNARTFAEQNLSKGQILRFLEHHLERVATKNTREEPLPQFSISHA